MSVTICFGTERRSVPQLLFSAKCSKFAKVSTVTIPPPFDAAAVSVFLSAVEDSSFNIPLDVVYDVRALSEFFGYAQLWKVTAEQIEALGTVDRLHQRLLELVFAIQRGESPDGGFVLANFDALQVYPAFAKIPPEYLQALRPPDGDGELQTKLTTTLIRTGRWSLTDDVARRLRASQVQIAADGGLELRRDVRSKLLPLAAHARELADDAAALAAEIDAAISDVRQTGEATVARERIAAIEGRTAEAGAGTREMVAALGREIAEVNGTAAEVERVGRNARAQVERGAEMERRAKAMLEELRRLEEQFGIE
jgi:hypothetical protein